MSHEPQLQPFECWCGVPAGELHTNECYQGYVLPRARAEGLNRQRIEKARDAVVEAACAEIDAWRARDWEAFQGSPLHLAVDAYREATK